MKSRRYRQLIKNPIVRLLRSIFRFFDRLFNPCRSKLRSRPDPSLFVEPMIEEPIVKRPPTIGEVLDSIDWQFTSGAAVKPTDLKSSLARVTPIRDSSTVKSRPATVPTARQNAAIPINGIKPTANTTRVVAAQRNSARTMTVGELFASVKWQQRQAPVEHSTRPPAKFDVSRN